MKIGFDAKRFFHNNTGLGNYSRGLIHDLRHFGNLTEVFLFDKNPASSNYLSAAENTQVVSPKHNWPLWRQIGIVNQIEELKLDVYHGLSAELPLAKPRNTKLVVTIHDLIFLKYPSYYPFVDRLIYTYKLRNALMYADRVICASEKTKEDIAKIFPKFMEKLKVIPQSCDPQFYERKSEMQLDAFKKKYNLPEHYLLCVSKFEKRKNHLQLLNAFATVASRISLPLVLVGRKGDTFEEVEQWLRNSVIKNKIILITDAAAIDLPNFYQGADWTIFPSVYEGFGIPVLESMASGTPVITTQNSSMSEITGPRGLSFDATNIESIADALLKSQMGAERMDAILNIDNELEKFSSTQIANQHITLYQTLT